MDTYIHTYRILKLKDILIYVGCRLYNRKKSRFALSLQGTSLLLQCREVMLVSLLTVVLTETEYPGF